LQARRAAPPPPREAPPKPKSASAWQAVLDANSGRIYYFNKETMAVQWETPDDL
jgi:WW domain